MARSLIDKIIYSITKKPKHYVEVKNPPKTAKEKLSRPQDARQINSIYKISEREAKNKYVKRNSKKQIYTKSKK